MVVNRRELLAHLATCGRLVLPAAPGQAAALSSHGTRTAGAPAAAVPAPAASPAAPEDPALAALRRSYVCADCGGRTLSLTPTEILRHKRTHAADASAEGTAT